MKKIYTTTTIKRVAVTVMTIVVAGLSLNYSGGPGNNGAGSAANTPFGSGTCARTGCHGGGNFSPSITVQLLSGTTPTTVYSSNTSYTLRITATASNTTSNTRYGFQVVSVRTGSPYTAVNGWGTLPTNTQTYTTGGRVHIEHSTPLTSNVIDIPWTSPNVSTGSITFYAAVNVVNNNSSQTGDNPVFRTLTVTPPCSTPSLSTSETHVQCKGGSDGAITLTTTGGSSPFTYAWTGPNSYTSSTQSPTNLNAGTYKVVVTATGGCKDSVTNIVITEPTNGMTVVASSNSPVCEGNDIQLNAALTGASGTPSFSWFGPNSYSSNNQNSTITGATPLMAGVYKVTVTDGSSCNAEDTVSVVVNPRASVDTFNFVQGMGADSNQITFTSVNIQNQNSIKWLFGDGDSVLGVADPVHTYPSSGVYTVLLIVENPCGADTIERQVNVDPVGVNDIKLAQQIAVYPNPANSMLFVDSRKSEGLKSVTIVDIAGRKIHEVRTLQAIEKIDVSNLRAGLYFLKLTTTDNKSIVQKVSIK